MKRSLLIFLSIVLALTPVGCGAGDGAASSQATSSAARTVTVSVSSDESAVPASSEESDPYAPTIYEVAAARDKFHVTGRTMSVAAGTQTGMLFDHAGQGMLFTADCEGDVTVDLALVSEGKQNSTDHQLFSVRVDGEAADVIVESGATETVRTITLAQDLPRGKHTFALYRCNEPLLGCATLLTVKMSGRVQTYVAPEGQLKMIFLGDSITAGHGTRVANGTYGQYFNKNRDATYTYAFLCGQALGAEFSLVARSSMATTTKPDAAANVNVYYDYYSYERPERVAYDASQEEVDVYVISLGTNDTSWSAEKIKPNALALIQRVRADHPKAKIVWAYGQMVHTNKDVYADAIEELGGASANLYFYLFSEPNRDGGATHPDAVHHAKDAEDLAAFIRSIL